MKTPRMQKMLANGWRPPVFRGLFHPGATLTPEKVFEIRRLLKEGALSVAKIATLFGVSQSAINHLKYEKTWKHLPVEQMPARRSLTRSGMNKAAAKLKDRDIPVIRTSLASGASVSEVSRRYGVSRPVIRGIRDGTAWTHV